MTAAEGEKDSALLERKGTITFAKNGPEWRRIEEVSSIEVRNVGHIASTVTLGIKEVRVICVFRGERAELQLANRRPVFRLAGLGASARDVYIVAMRLNPDRRDLEMGRTGLIKKLSYGFRKRDVRDVDVKRLGDDLLEVTPKQDLEPGEYIMVLGGVAAPLNMPGTRSRSRGVIMPGACRLARKVLPATTSGLSQIKAPPNNFRVQTYLECTPTYSLFVKSRFPATVGRSN